MTGVEGGPTPEEMGLKPSDMNITAPNVEQLTPDVGNVPEAEATPEEQPVEQPEESENEVPQSEEERPADEPQPDDKPRWGEITPEQQEGMDEIQREVAAGLGMLYDILPRSGKIKEDRIVKALNQIKTVENMGPAVKNKIAFVVARDKLHEGNKEDFVLQVLNIDRVIEWVMSQGSQRADSKRADSLLEQIKNMSTPRTQ